MLLISLFAIKPPTWSCFYCSAFLPLFLPLSLSVFFPNLIKIQKDTPTFCYSLSLLPFLRTLKLISMVKKRGWTPWPLKYTLRSTLLLAVNQKWGLFFDMSFLFLYVSCYLTDTWNPNLTFMSSSIGRPLDVHIKDTRTLNVLDRHCNVKENRKSSKNRTALSLWYLWGSFLSKLSVKPAE